MTDAAEFTAHAAALVAANDRRARRRGLYAALRHAAERLGLAWSALLVVALLLWILPMSTRSV